ncbi:MAG: leucine-rich repeat domain-containing protein [Lachnospiraceae bacterium]
MNYVLERMKKSRMLALFLVLSMLFSLMPVNMASATEGEATGTTCSLQFSASDLDMADITYKLGDDTATTVVSTAADENGAIWVKDIANDTTITIQVKPKQESQISDVNVKEGSSGGAEAYEGSCASNEDGSYTYTFTASGGRTYYVVLNTGNNTPGGETANTGDVLIETSEAQNGKVFYSFDGQSWTEITASTFTLRASNELVDITDSAIIYLKATPNDGQAFDDYQDETQKDSNDQPLTNNRMEVKSGENTTISNIDTNQLKNGSYCIPYSKANAYTVRLRFAGNNNDNPGSEASKEYDFDGEATSTITFNGNTGYDGAGMFLGAIFYINGVAAQERTYDAENQRDTVTRKESVTYPYDAEDPNTPKITEGETEAPAVEFEFLCPINMRYTEIKINGTDYSPEIPGANPATRKWEILDAMDLNGNSQTVSFILTVPYAESYAVTANMDIIGNREDEYGMENGKLNFSVMNAQNATIGYTYGQLMVSDITAEEATFPEQLTQGEMLTLFAKAVEGQEMLGFHLAVGGNDVDWDTLDSQGAIDSAEGFSFTITQDMANNGLQVFLEFSYDEAEAASYFPAGNFLWSNLEQDKDSDVYLDHTIIEFVKFTYVDRNGQTVTYNSLEDMDKANLAYLHFDDDVNAGEATLIAGGEITVRLIPRYGYQVVEFGPNGGKMGTSDTEACVYTFTIANGNAHIGAKCAPVEDKVASTVEEVKDGNIELAADELDMGTAILNVDETTTTATEQAAFETAAEGYDVESYLDLNLDQVVYRGSAEQMWEKEVTELKEKATISLTVDGDYENGVEIVHQKHDGTYEVIAAQYDKETKEVTFETDSFSKYAICSKAQAHVHAGTKVAAVPATCVTAGNSEYYTCNCGKYFSDAACTKEIVKDSWVIVATGHKWDNGTVTKEATATEDGVKTYHCTNAGCTETKTEAIPATGVPATGTEIQDEKGTASYEVTGSDAQNPTVTYTGTTSSTTKTVTIPATVTVDGVTYKVTAIADSAFKDNKTITKVTIPKNVTTIGKNAFSGCTKLKTVTVGSDVTTIEANAFKGCKALTKITLPSKTTNIGANAFNGCTKLKTITIQSKKLTSKTVSKNAFKGVSATATIKVPSGKAKSYKTLFQKKGLNKKAKVK